MSTTKIIGVMGGLGPAATHDFFGKIISRTKAQREQDHLRVMIDNNPHVPDRNAAMLGQGPSPGPALAQMARVLEASGAEVIVMACNAAHAWEADIRAAIRVPFLSMIGETVAAVKRLPRSHGRVGVLAVNAARRARLYESAFEAEGFDTVLPGDAEQDAFMKLVYRVKAGDVGPATRREMKVLAENLVTQGVDAVVAGCTEVPLVLAAADITAPLVSSTDVLVDRVILFAGAELTKA